MSCQRTISRGWAFACRRSMPARTKPPYQNNRADMPIDPALFLLDGHGVITGWTGAAETASGHQPQELRGLGFDRLFSTGAPAGGIEAALRTARRNGRFTTAGWFTPKNGSRVQMKLLLEPLRSRERGIEGFAATLGEPALGDGEQKFRMLVQGVTDYAIYMVDPQGYITNW